MSLLQDAAQRVADAERFAPPMLVCNEEHRFVAAEQVRAIGIRPGRIILEPEGRNTAPAIALVALSVEPDTQLLILPSDHVIKKPKALISVIAKGARAAAQGRLVTFGAPPTRPETGYGYIRQGAALPKAAGVFEVAEFTEKPDLTAAQLYVSGRQHLWNSGMFLFRAGDFVDELNAHAPKVLSACKAAIANGKEDKDFFRPGAPDFRKAPAISIDYAVMENTRRAAVVPADIGWSDLGSFDALWESGKKDKAGNVTFGSTILKDVEDSFVWSDGRLVAAIGLPRVILVATDDVVLAVPRERAQDVKSLVSRLRKQNRDESDAHSWVHRPWGSYQVIDTGEGFKAKRLTVKPGHALSLQRHQKRAEHWVVVSGTAEVTRDGETLSLEANQSTYIPAGMAHRLANRGDAELHIIEVQSGDYLGEDDIERLDDDWGRG
jgi:mannose-1-phosphate guanylyltransferase/mannose-1-phosphate guanylyltransferase/mannose-6-phosphate isomerase